MHIPCPVGAELAAAVASICFGASVVATRFVVSQVDPVALAFLRYLIAILCLLPLARGVSLRSMPRRDVTAVLALGALFFGVFPWSFSAALTYIPASRVAVELAAMPLLTLLVSRMRGYDQLTLPKVLGQLLAFVGLSFALRAPAGTSVMSGDAWKGDALIGVTSLCGACYNVFSRPYLKRYSPLHVTVMSMVAGVVLLAPIALARGVVADALTFSPSIWFGVLFLGIVGGATGFYLWILALGRATPARVAVFFPLNPITALLLGVLLLHETITFAFVVGLSCVLAGIFLANWRQPSRPTASSS